MTRQGIARKAPPPRWAAIGLAVLGVAVGSGAVAPAGAAGPAGQNLDEAGTEPSNGLVVESLRVAGSALRPRASDDTYSASDSGGCIYMTGGSTLGVLNTPLQLPDGASVIALRMYYNDTSASDSVGWFTIYDLYGGLVKEYSVLSSGNSGVGFAESGPIDHVIDYNLYSYVLNWRPNVAGSSMQLCGFRVFYNPPVLFVDGFETGNTSQWSLTLP